MTKKQSNWRVTDTTGMTGEQVAELVAKESKPKKAPTKKAKKPAAPKPPAEPKPEKKLHGRPTKRTPEIEEEIFERMSQGETLREICRSEHMPHYSVVYDWKHQDKDFSQRFATARDKGHEVISEECMEIADNARNDWMEKHGGDGDVIGYQLNGEHVQRSKLRIETRLKLLAIWNSAKFGGKLDVNHGVQPDNPLAKLFEQVAGNAIRPKDDTK
jgi:hypothetical protein